QLVHFLQRTSHIAVGVFCIVAPLLGAGENFTYVAAASTKKAPAVVFVDRNSFLDEAESLARLGVASLLIDAHSVVDVRRGLDELERRPEIDKTRIAFVGLSDGARLGALLLAEEKRFRAFVLMGGGFASDGQPPHTAPVFFQFARNDESIDYAQATRFIEATPPPRVAKRYEGGHEFNAFARRDRLACLSTLR